MYRKSDFFTIIVLVLVFEQTGGMALGEDCTSTACTTANAVCPATGTKTCTCATGYTQQGTACKADLGTACTTTADCDTTTAATDVCDVLATPAVCKIKSTGDCTGKTDKCVSGAACTTNACACYTKYKENTDKLCATVLGSTCTITADCTSTVANSDCTGTGTKTCTCATGYTKQGAECKADLGTACTTTADCDTTTTTTAVCDVLATTKVCKIKSTGDCTGKTDKCVSGAACTTNACACSTKYKENTDKLCVTVLGSTCTITADCTSTVANSDCTGTGTKTCTCATGYTKQGAECKADLGTACTTTADCDTTTTTTAVCDVLATTKVCKIKSTGDCTGKTDKCVSGAACKTNACACSTKYKENTDKLCATVLGSTCTATADCNSTVANSTCTGTSGSMTCTCDAGFTKQGADCSAGAAGGATGAAACLVMIMACIFTNIL
ncbi:stabilin-2-like [Dreissena polymorpha]|uniref:EGF-like domain-containing protein n=1 Tax=Dreissena polymorpha TaxID=45954 RepID=A0A9D4I900_DREPO|nr:stabilin-2-like [Dreissena polymorpha]KAH3752739.1 hypothetical protein DPMN_187365 [Dreissena polymorpha]